MGQNNTAVVLKVGAETTTSSSSWNLLGMQILGPSPGPLYQICHCALEFENAAGDELGDLLHDDACTPM